MARQRALYRGYRRCRQSRVPRWPEGTRFRRDGCVNVGQGRLSRDHHARTLLDRDLPTSAVRSVLRVPKERVYLRGPRNRPGNPADTLKRPRRVRTLAMAIMSAIPRFAVFLAAFLISAAILGANPA